MNKPIENNAKSTLTSQLSKIAKQSYLVLLTLFNVFMECTKFIGKIYFSDEEATNKLEKVVFYVGWSLIPFATLVYCIYMNHHM